MCAPAHWQRTARADDTVTIVERRETKAMIRDEKLQRIIERAIQSAFVDFPDAGKRDGVAENLQRAQRMQDYRNSHPLSS